MDLDEFETLYRDAIEESLNQLQTVVLLIAQLESQVADVGESLQNLSLTVEEFIAQQRAE